jgi:hypothetical protein
MCNNRRSRDAAEKVNKKAGDWDMSPQIKNLICIPVPEELHRHRLKTGTYYSNC